MTEQQQPSAPASEEQVVVVGPDGQPIGTIPASALPAMTQQSDDDGEEGGGERHITELVEQLRGEKAPVERWNPTKNHQKETGRFE